MSDNIYVAPSRFGSGVFAARNIKRGEVILTFSGPIITFQQAVAMGVDEANALQIDATYYMDLEQPGRSVNHSCAPNAGIKQHTQLGALRPIRRDEEIRYDYSTTMHEDHWTMPCRCGAVQCRGVVRDFRSLPARVQQHYLDLGIVQPFIVSELQLS
jgi:uncharacterized protein